MTAIPGGALLTSHPTDFQGGQDTVFGTQKAVLRNNMLPLVPLIPNYLYILGGHGRYKSLGRDHQSVRINISTCGTFIVSLGTWYHAFGEDESRTLHFQQTEVNTVSTKYREICQQKSTAVG